MKAKARAQQMADLALNQAERQLAVAQTTRLLVQAFFSAGRCAVVVPPGPPLVNGAQPQARTLTLTAGYFKTLSGSELAEAVLSQCRAMAVTAHMRPE